VDGKGWYEEDTEEGEGVVGEGRGVKYCPPSCP